MDEYRCQTEINLLFKQKVVLPNTEGVEYMQAAFFSLNFFFKNYLHMMVY